MTEDPYRLDDDLQLSALPQNESEDEFDGLDLEEAPKPEKKSIKKMPLVIGVLGILVVAGGGFFAYQTFLGGDDFAGGPIIPPPAATPPMPGAMPGDAIPPAPDAGLPAVPGDATAVPGDLPPGVTPSPVAGVPAEQGMTPPAADPNAPPNAPMAPVDPNAPLAPEAANADPAVAADPNVPADAQQPAVPKDAAAAELEKPVQEEETPPALAAAAVEDEADPTLASSGESVKSDAAASQENAKAEEAALQPIDPAPAAPSVPSPKAPAADKTAKTIAEVNEILGGTQAAAVPGANQMPAEIEITSRAREVIVVKKSYSAQSPQAVIAAGDRVLNAGQYGAAAEIYDQQLKKNPSDPNALAGKAVALQKSGDYAEAMNTYDRLLKLNPRDVEALTNYLGLLQDQDPAQALERLQQLSQQYPDNAAVAGQTGAAYAKMNDTPNALRYLLKAQSLDGTNATYPFNLGVLYDRLGTTAKARDSYRRALDLVRNYSNNANAVPVDVIRRRLSTMGG